MLDFETLRNANIERDKEWDPEHKITIEFRGLELAGEAGEACNATKKYSRALVELPGSKATVYEILEELADVVISADLLAMQLGHDLGRAITEKFNTTSLEYGLKTRIKMED